MTATKSAPEILVVDDNPDNLRLMNGVLRDQHYAVRVAPGGEAALRSVQLRLPDLILLDVKMPVMDGLEVCRRLKADPASRDVPVIFLSALREHEDKLRGFEAGGVDYITKPFVAEEVLARVRAHLALHDMQRTLQREVAEQTRALRTLSAGNHAVVHAENVDGLLDAVCRAIVEEGGYLSAWVTIDDGTQCYRGENGDDKRRDCDRLANQISDPEGPALVAVQGAGRDQALCDCAARAALLLPLVDQGRILGRLLVCAAEPLGFAKPGDVALLQEVAGDLGYGIQALRTRIAHGRSREVLERSLSQTIHALAATVEVRDPYTAGHQHRTALLAKSIGKCLGLDEQRIKGLFVAGAVHDIGKISVPVSILSRPGRLTDAEFAVIKEHSRIGYEILKGIDFPWPVADIIHQHHERLDGSGYPQGLKGDEILPEARILAVADVTEAISSHRPYRPALGVEVAIDELKRGRGKQLDAEAVDCCLRILEEEGLPPMEEPPSWISGGS